MWRAEEDGTAAAASACAKWRLQPDGAPVVTFLGYLQPVRRCGVALIVKAWWLVVLRAAGRVAGVC